MPRKSGEIKSGPAHIVREYGPFPEGEQVAGVTFDGESVWFASTDHLQAFDPATGEARKRLEVPAEGGTAFDGRHLFQLAGGRINKVDPKTGEIVGSLPSPGKGRDSGLTWAEGKLWVGQHRDRKVHQIDAETGEILRTLESPRFVTGVTWLDGELWYGTWEDDVSDLRHVDPDSGELLEELSMPKGTMVSGLESNGRDTFFCGGGSSGKVRAVRRPKR
jgi:hypothetical protein